MATSLTWLSRTFCRTFLALEEQLTYNLRLIYEGINPSTALVTNIESCQSTGLSESKDDGFLLMAVPKKRTSASKKKLRNRHKWLKNRSDIETCVVCGNHKLANHLCGHCLAESFQNGITHFWDLGDKKIQVPEQLPELPSEPKARSSGNENGTGGLLAGSLAIMTDAAHMLSDFAAFLISLFAIWVAHWLPDKKRTFGYYRAEVLGALVSVLIIWVLTGVLVYLAVQRVITQDFDINADIMLITAGIGLGVNILLGIILHQTGMGHNHSHGMGSSHGHGHSHSSNKEESIRRISRSNSLRHSEKQNINVRAAFIHVLGDIVQSVGVLIAAYIIKFKPEWKLADPICTFVFSLVVLITTLNILKETIHVLMEGTPKDIKYNSVKMSLESIEGVVAAHSLHIWSLTVNKAALAVHLAIEQGHDSQKVLNIANQKLKNEFRIFHSTIQVELYQESVMTNCVDCQDLQD
ncbi:unnamed protein product [Porites lobata]|uniref:Zinc transporter 2 n=14 Tax=Eukaryota TaxID=2759 RepID=A0ABN8RMC0_9CNID|nr:unnamed protein product [Porites lobata]